jgi:orotate phosphoribosyltransferase
MPLITIGLSVYLLRHPSFIAILDMENDFGIVLGVLLGAIIIISSVWLVVGIRQYRLIGSWNKRYGDYIKEKQERDTFIASQYIEDTTTMD